MRSELTQQRSSSKLSATTKVEILAERTTPLKNAIRLLLVIPVLGFLLVHPFHAAMTKNLLVHPSHAAMAQDDQGDTDCDGVTMTQSLKTLNSSGVTGTASLCIGANGVRGHINAASLTAANAYTVWFVYFDNPSNCMNPGQCTPADTVLPLANPEGVFGRFDSTVANGDNTEFFGRVGGMQLSSGSEVHLPVFNHGAASTSDGRFRARELLTPQNPNLGAPGLGTSTDGVLGKPVAVAIFSIP